MKSFYEETLEEYKARISEPGYEFDSDIEATVESELNNIAICQDVKNTISYRELLMIAYIRSSMHGDMNRFYRAAKSNYEAFMGIVDLFPKK